MFDFTSAINIFMTVFICYILLYALVDRICKCCERCSMNKAIGLLEKEVAEEWKTQIKEHTNVAK